MCDRKGHKSEVNDEDKAEGNVYHVSSQKNNGDGEGETGQQTKSNPRGQTESNVEYIAASYMISSHINIVSHSTSLERNKRTSGPVR